MPVWKKAGHLVLSTVRFLQAQREKDMPVVVVDLREPQVAQKGHIPGAVSIPSGEVAFAKFLFPEDKTAPIVLYSDEPGEAEEAFKTVRGWGYKNTTVLKGGFEAYLSAGLPIEKGPLATEILYVPKPRPGEIPVGEFKQIVAKLPPDKFILDVRDVDEAMQGMLKNAVNIPTEELQANLHRIPKDKEIIIHCITGVRAEMAYHILKEAGYKARFLNATITIDPDGHYEITK